MEDQAKHLQLKSKKFKRPSWESHKYFDLILEEIVGKYEELEIWNILPFVCKHTQSIQSCALPKFLKMEIMSHSTTILVISFSVFYSKAHEQSFELLWSSVFWGFDVWVFNPWSSTNIKLVNMERRSLSQWRRTAKCRPWPTTKLSPFPSLKFACKNLKWKKTMFRAYLKIKGLINHREKHNQTLTNWKGSCFSLSIMSLAFSACRHLSHHYSSYNFCFLHIYWLGVFREKFFPICFKLPLCPPLDFKRLLIPGDQTKT